MPLYIFVTRLIGPLRTWEFDQRCIQATADGLGAGKRLRLWDKAEDRKPVGLAQASEVSQLQRDSAPDTPGNPWNYLTKQMLTCSLKSLV